MGRDEGLSRYLPPFLEEKELHGHIEKSDRIFVNTSLGGWTDIETGPQRDG